MVELARKAAGVGDVDRGWCALHAAYRVEMTSASPDQLQAKVIAVRREATAPKIHGWRREALVQLLEEPGFDPVASPSHASVLLQQAMLIRDEVSQDDYYKLSLFAQHRGYLSVLLIAALIGAGVLGLLGSLTFDAPLQAVSISVVMLFGAMGALVSALTSTVVRPKGMRIPDQIGQLVLAPSRPAVGAAAAVLALLLLHSGLLALPGPGGATALAAAFVAGTSERLVLRAMSAAVRNSRPG